MFEDRLAILEETEECVATSTGMSAILSCIMSLCRPGEHVIVSRSVFGTTVKLFDNVLSEWGLRGYLRFTFQVKMIGKIH